MKFDTPFPHDARRYDLWSAFYHAYPGYLYRFEHDSAMLTSDAWKPTSRGDGKRGYGTFIGSDSFLPTLYLNGEPVPQSHLQGQLWFGSQRLCVDYDTGVVVASLKYCARWHQHQDMVDAARASIPANLIGSAAVYWPRAKERPIGAPVTLYVPVPDSPEVKRQKRDLLLQARAWGTLSDISTSPLFGQSCVDWSEVANTAFADLPVIVRTRLVKYGFSPASRKPVTVACLSVSKTES